LAMVVTLLLDAGMIATVAPPMSWPIKIRGTGGATICVDHFASFARDNETYRTGPPVVDPADMASSRTGLRQGGPRVGPCIHPRPVENTHGGRHHAFPAAGRKREAAEARGPCSRSIDPSRTHARRSGDMSSHGARNIKPASWGRADAF
jgi:hypothetical protein